MYDITHLVIAVCLGIGLGLLIARGRFLGDGAGKVNRFQNDGEELLANAVRANFSSPDYHLLNHITLPLQIGTTEVDHILVSRFGVFVIETKHYKGWIFAHPKQVTWTQVIFYRQFKFQNPIFQNLRHVRAVQELLDFLPHDAVHSVVVFTGDAEFKTDIPAGVFYLSDFVKYVQSLRGEIMSVNRLQFCVGRLETTRLSISQQTDIEHIQNLKRWHGRLWR